MSPVFALLVLALVVAQSLLPRKWGFLPLAIAGLHLGNVEVLPELTPARMLILIGLGRALAAGHFIWSSKSRLDWSLVFFGIFALLSAIGHKSDEYVPSPLNARAGLFFNAFGTYLYGRAYLPDIQAFRRYIYLLPLVLIPLGALLTVEKHTRVNLYYSLGGRSETSQAREDKIRAQGPFQHPILAGTAGATALPFSLILWRSGFHFMAAIGVVSCLSIVFACSSSGPLAAVGVTLAAICFWRWRNYVKHAIWGLVFLGLLYTIVKGRGPWFIMSSIDLVGGSTGWHRAELMNQGFFHLDEWWLCGTDYTRHWMASGMRWNPNHVDLTNYYLHLGVLGGLPLMLSVVAMLIIGFQMLFRRMTEMRVVGDADEFVLWCAAASLAAHAISFISISYFDQMYIFFYLHLGVIPGLVTSTSSLNIKPLVPSQSEPIPVQPLRYYS